MIVTCQDDWCVDGYEGYYCVYESDVRDWADACDCGFLREGDSNYIFVCDSSSGDKAFDTPPEGIR